MESGQTQYPLLVSEWRSAPAAISISTTRVWPFRAEYMREVHLPRTRLTGSDDSRPSDPARPVPAVGLVGDGSAGGDEHLDHARVAMFRRKYKCREPKPGTR